MAVRYLSMVICGGRKLAAVSIGAISKDYFEVIFEIYVKIDPLYGCSLPERGQCSNLKLAVVPIGKASEAAVY